MAINISGATMVSVEVHCLDALKAAKFKVVVAVVWACFAFSAYYWTIVSSILAFLTGMFSFWHYSSPDSAINNECCCLDPLRVPTRLRTLARVNMVLAVLGAFTGAAAGFARDGTNRALGIVAAVCAVLCFIAEWRSSTANTKLMADMENVKAEIVAAVQNKLSGPPAAAPAATVLVIPTQLIPVQVAGAPTQHVPPPAPPAQGNLYTGPPAQYVPPPVPPPAAPGNPNAAPAAPKPSPPVPPTAGNPNATAPAAQHAAPRGNPIADPAAQFTAGPVTGIPLN